MMLANKLKEDEEEKLSLHHVNVQLLHFKYPMLGGGWGLERCIIDV